MKSARTIIDASFRAIMRDARKIDRLIDSDPFAALDLDGNATVGSVGASVGGHRHPSMVSCSPKTAGSDREISKYSKRRNRCAWALTSTSLRTRKANC